MPEQVINNSSATPFDVKAKQEALKNNRKGIPSNIKVVDNPNQGLDKNSFLKLLVTELSHQDPMKPMNDREFISQMAQFSALEQMQNVSKSMNSLKAFQANSLVGKVITGKDMVHGREISGMVEKIMYDKNGNVFLRVQNYTVKLDDIFAIEEARQNQTTQLQSPVQNQQPVNAENVSRETISPQAQPEIEKDYRNFAKNFVYNEIFKPVTPEN